MRLDSSSSTRCTVTESGTVERGEIIKRRAASLGGGYAKCSRYATWELSDVHVLEILGHGHPETQSQVTICRESSNLLFRPHRLLDDVRAGRRDCRRATARFNPKRSELRLSPATRRSGSRGASCRVGRNGHRQRKRR